MSPKDPLFNPVEPVTKSGQRSCEMLVLDEGKQPLPWWASTLHRVGTCFPLWLKGKGIKVYCSWSHSHTPHGGITVLSGLSVLLMQPSWKWLVCREKLWPGLSDGPARVLWSPNLKPFSWAHSGRHVTMLTELPE